MHNGVLKQIVLLVQQAEFISLNCDKVTILDNQFWIFVHGYVVDNWHRVLIHLNLERTIDGSTFDNLITMIIHYLVILGGMSKIDIINKMVCFGADGVTIFQGLKIGVTT